jgi:hypothetical protein
VVLFWWRKSNWREEKTLQSTTNSSMIDTTINLYEDIQHYFDDYFVTIRPSFKPSRRGDWIVFMEATSMHIILYI